MTIKQKQWVDNLMEYNYPSYQQNPLARLQDNAKLGKTYENLEIQQFCNEFRAGQHHGEEGEQQHHCRDILS